MKHKILLVDDEESVLQSLSRVLRKHYDVTTCTNGHDGLLSLLEDLEQEPFAVVIADQKMPLMDGVEFLASVRAKSPNTVRIMLSGSRDFDASIRAVNEGNVYRFLTKPFPAKQLLEVLAMAVEQYEVNRATCEATKMKEAAAKTIAVCSYCTKVREPEAAPQSPESWERIELFLSRKFGFRFTHSVCPECVDRLYAELEEQKRKVTQSLIIGSKES